MSKLEFYNKSERYKDIVNMDIIKFIDNITEFPDMDGNISGNIDHLFCAGYCYYFANMLKLAFGGTVCWSEDRGHIVWVDGNDLENDIAYDITGIYEDYTKLRPIEYLGDTICDFKHNGDKFSSGSVLFKEWYDFYKTTELEAISLIWQMIPYDELECYDKQQLNLPEAAIDYWYKNSRDLQVFFKNKNKSIANLHSGIPNIKGE